MKQDLLCSEEVTLYRSKVKKSSAFCGAERSTFSRLPLYSALQLDLLMICTQSSRVCEGPSSDITHSEGKVVSQREAVCLGA